MSKSGNVADFKRAKINRRIIKDVDCSQRIIGPRMRGRIDAIKEMAHWQVPKSFEEEFGDDLKIQRTLKKRELYR